MNSETHAVPLPGRDTTAGRTRLHHDHAHRDAQDWWVPIFRGSWLAIFGAFALFSPPVTIFTVSYLFAAAAFVTAGVLLTNGYSLRAPLPIAQGALSMVVALVVGFMPRDLWQVSAVVASFWAIGMGAIDFVMVRRHRALRGRAYAMAAGALLVLGGVVGLVLTFVGDVPVRLIGAFGLAIGAALIGYGLRRRRRKGRTSAIASAHADEERRLDEAHAV